MDIALRVIGAAGLVIIIVGMLLRSRKERDELYIVGGVFLGAYSIYIGDVIFTILQVVFTAVAVYDLLRRRKKR